MPTATPPEIETKLRQSADALESAATRPVVEVGVEDYCGVIMQRLSDAQKAWAEARDLHHELCAEIVKVDPALAPTTDSLTETHGAITAQIVDLVSEALSIAGSADESARLADTQGLKARVLSQVAECRNYEDRLNKALLDAHLRDRGRGAS